MAVRPVLTYPHPLLKEKLPRTSPEDPRLAGVFEDLIDTLLAHPGCVGLAASQVGHPLRCLVVDVSRSLRDHAGQGLLKLVDPQVLEASQWKAGREGCLSFPDLLANVKRARKLTLEAWNEKGVRVRVESVEFEAVALQHEMDHLDGILFLDRIRSSKDLFERRKTPV